MKINTDKGGWESIFFKWQIESINSVYNHPEGVTATQVSSEVKSDISRTSIIFFLQDFAERGFVKSVKRRGKGGGYMVYSPTCTKPELSARIRQFITEYVERELSGDIGE